MRGLLGDATEEFIENLANKDNEDQDEEEIYKMANVMAVNGGLKVMLNRLEHVQDTIRSKQLLIVLLKLFGHCVKVKQNREKLLDPDLKTIPILLEKLIQLQSRCRLKSQSFISAPVGAILRF